MPSRLPSLRPLDPAWPMIAVVGFIGGAITSAMAGSTVIPLLCLCGAAAAALGIVRMMRTHSTAEYDVECSEPNE